MAILSPSSGTVLSVNRDVEKRGASRGVGAFPRCPARGGS